MQAWIDIGLQVLLVIHFGYHLIAAFGVTVGLLHSHTVHKHSKWKIAAAVVWLLISILLLVVSHDALDHTNCH